jgi:pilus assembly protein CpaB
MKPKVVLLVSIAVGVVAFWLTARYLRAERLRLEGRTVKIQVVVAARDLPTGTVIKKSDIAMASVPKDEISGRAVLADDFRDILDRKLVFNVGYGRAILWSDVGVEDLGEGKLAETVSKGLRAVSISVDAVASVSGLVRPDDRVDILGTFSTPSRKTPGEVETVTLTVLQDVSVLATGTRMGRRAGPGARAPQSGARGFNTVTLEVSPREAELLAFLEASKGRVTLSLRNPADGSFVTDLPAVDFDRLQQSLPELNLIRQRDIRHNKDAR